MRSCGKPGNVADWLSRYGLASYNLQNSMLLNTVGSWRFVSPKEYNGLHEGKKAWV
jgi:hypothetical protein